MKIGLVVESGPGLGNGGGVRKHADGARHLGQVAAGHHRRRLVVDAHLKFAEKLSLFCAFLGYKSYNFNFLYIFWVKIVKKFQFFCVFLGKKS